MLVTVALLLSAERVSRLAGKQGLLAFERLMGLILTAIAVEMLLGGIQTFVRRLCDTDVTGTRDGERVTGTA